MNDNLATYAFLPWVRQGIATAVKTQDSLGQPSGVIERATVDVGVGVNNALQIDKTVDIVGPGDVIGINSRAIVKTEPRRLVADFEPNYLPYIEFYDEDFAWRYTPAAAAGNHRLRPWLFLAVLSQDEFERGTSSVLPFVRLKVSPANVLPNPEQTWAWAHVHVSRDITDENRNSVSTAVSELDELIRRNPDSASCRIMSPRKLQPNMRYVAFLIPTFETGRLVGMGQPTQGVDAMASAWGIGQTEFPVYYEWSFGTGSRGDFEYLVSLLESRTIDARVGIRDMDVQRPEFGLAGLADPGVLGLEGALRSPFTAPRPLTWPDAAAAEFSDNLKKIINLQADALEENPPQATANPLVSAPLYGRWHANITRLLGGSAGWVHELNEDPRLRVAAGMATSVVQKNQEQLMQRAWQQLGEIQRANTKIRFAQLGLAVNHSIFTQKIGRLSDASVINIAQPMLSRLKSTANTLQHGIAKSRLPDPGIKPAFRKLTRPRGVLLRKILPKPGAISSTVLSGLNSGALTAASPKSKPSGQISFNDASPTRRRPSAAISSTTPIGRATANRSRIVSRRAPVAADLVSENALNLSAITTVPPRDNFALSQPGSALSSLMSAGARDNDVATRFRTAVGRLHQRFYAGVQKPPVAQPAPLSGMRAQITDLVNPAITVPSRIRSIVQVRPSVRPTRESETISPIMAHPEYPDPMYAPLRDIDSEFLVPNLSLIPQNTIGLLQTNKRFIEAYMVGLNHEFGRELLWREYFTDQQGSYFRQFWDVSDAVNRNPQASAAAIEESLRDIKPLHQWPANSLLGTNENRDLATGTDDVNPRLVLIIRGDLLRRYPTAVVYAQKAKWEADEFGRQIRVLDESSPETNILEPMFKAEIEPDIRFLGFDLTIEDAKGVPHPRVNQPGWFFVIQERPGEPRFGLNLDDEDTPARPASWEGLAWGHLSNQPPDFIHLDQGPNTNAIVALPDAGVRWGSNAAEMAYLLYQTPVMVAYHAADMLRDIEQG